MISKFLGTDGKYHPTGSFLGRDGNTIRRDISSAKTAATTLRAHSLAVMEITIAEVKAFAMMDGTIQQGTS